MIEQPNNTDDASEHHRLRALDRFDVAFSRDQRNKVYVQHRLKSHGAELWSLIGERNATVVVSGSSNQMPKDVRECFKEIFIEHGHLSIQDAEKLLEELRKRNRYQEEVWS
jgi:sulfite reductase (NADPH) flavoprotein alpha-component